MVRNFHEPTSHSAPSSPRLGHKPHLTSSLVSGSAFKHQQRAVTNQHAAHGFRSDASIVLVGVRGSGKRSLGLIAATALGRRFITEDWAFQSVTGLSRHDYLKVHGSEEFHKQDVNVTRKMLDENRTNCVIDCGLGSLTSSLQDYLKQYCLHNPVIYLIRDLEQILLLFNLSEKSARLLEAGDASHRKCSNYEYYNLEEPIRLHNAFGGDGSLQASSFRLSQVQEDFSHFVRLLLGQEPSEAVSPYSIEVPVITRSFTHVLGITLSRFEAGIDWSELETAADAVEVMVDRWISGSAKAVSRFVSLVRRYVKVPVIYSVKSNTIESNLATTILNHGIRLGVEFLSVNLEMLLEPLRSLCDGSRRSQVLCTYAPDDRPKLGWKDPQLKAMINKAVSLRAEMVRIVLPAHSRDDQGLPTWFAEEVRTVHPEMKVIAYESGHAGRHSQLLNALLTPVTHGQVKDVENDSQASLTSRQLLKSLFDSFVFDPLNFCIVGGNVTQSLSPAMHNAGYKHLGLQHSCTTHNIKTWEDIEQLATNSAFGGASIVQPWKVKIVEKVSSISHHGKAIGAVNTLVPLRISAGRDRPSLELEASNRNRSGRVIAWHAENTDWLGIRACLSRSLIPRNVVQPRTTALVVGAGGMARSACYALLQMGCRHVFIFNRTIANARSVADHFNTWIETQADASPMATSTVNVIANLNDPWPEKHHMPTMIVSCVTHEVLDGNPGANFQVPEQWLGSPSGGVVVEMAYMSKSTALIQQMQRYREQTKLPWVIVDGISTLIEQAMSQFEIMTGRRAPRRIMTEAVRAALRENQEYVADVEVYKT